MRKEIEIILSEEDSKNKVGSIFEEFVSILLKRNRYKITSNVNFSGMEIDLICEHKDRVREILYVECKAKKRLESVDITKFAFNVDFKEATIGYFYSTSEFTNQVAGLIDEIQKKEKYSNLHFFGPEKIIEILTDTDQIKKPEIPKELQHKITKEVLVWSYFGTFLIYLVNDGTVPTSFLIFDANTGRPLTDSAKIKSLKSRIEDISNLPETSISESNSLNIVPDKQVENTIAEVTSSEKWFELLPASGDSFVGRDEVIKGFFNFIESVKNNTESKRVFYIDGNSGWGKSSLIAKLREDSQNGENIFTYAVDCRSIQTPSFATLALDKMLRRAFESNFISRDLFLNSDVKITSNSDLLSSDSMKALLEKLNNENKVMVLIFDQFEDIFLKPDYYKTFYKLLIDTNDISSNLLVGFSWKSDISIPIGEAYTLWHQAQDSAYRIHLQQFREQEVDEIIRKLEKSLNSKDRLNLPLKRKLKENSQGFPWLIKKLASHVYQLYDRGMSIQEISQSDMDIESLFKSDLKSLSPEETKALNFIAMKAANSNHFDSSEIGEDLEGDIVHSLLNKRLVVKSGSKFNIYWDIFRDYLVSGIIPAIGDSFILRLNPKSCVKVFEKLSSHYTSLDKIAEKTPSLSKGTLDNILRELLNWDLIEKASNIDEYRLINGITPSEQHLKKHIKSKFTNYKPYQEIKAAIRNEKLKKSEIIEILKKVFISSQYDDKTWAAYTNVLIAWIDFLELSIKDQIDNESKRNTFSEKYEQFTLKPNRARLSNYPHDIEKLLLRLKDSKTDFNKMDLNEKIDLALLGLIQISIDELELTDDAYELFKLSEGEFKRKLASLASKLPIISKILNKHEKSGGSFRTRELLKTFPKDFQQYRADEANYVQANVQNKWGKFVYYSLRGIDLQATKLPYYPDKLLDLISRLVEQGKIEIINSNIRRELNSLVYLGIINSSKKQEFTKFGKSIVEATKNKNILLAKAGLRMVKIWNAYEVYKDASDKSNWTYLRLYKVEGIFNESNKESTKKQTAAIILKWIEFIDINLKNETE